VEALLFHDSSKSFVEDSMWDMVSSAKSSNPPLSKDIFLQERGTADDHWEDEAYGDQDAWGEDDEFEEDNWLSNDMSKTESLPLFYSLNRFIDHEACISAGSVEICRASFILDVVGEGADSTVKRAVEGKLVSQ
jgi:hypothetical protein